MTDREDQAQAAINEILERLTRIETRLCKLMLYMNIDPSIKDGYRRDHRPAPKPVTYWENRQ